MTDKSLPTAAPPVGNLGNLWLVFYLAKRDENDQHFTAYGSNHPPTDAIV